MSSVLVSVVGVFVSGFLFGAFVGIVRRHLSTLGGG